MERYFTYRSFCGRILITKRRNTTIGLNILYNVED